MKGTTKLMVAAILGNASLAFAAGETGSGMGLGAYIFLGFFALILVFQAVPGLFLLCGMLKGLFSPRPRKAVATGKPTEGAR